jgi:hypothetical protein
LGSPTKLGNLDIRKNYSTDESKIFAMSPGEIDDDVGEDSLADVFDGL